MADAAEEEEEDYDDPLAEVPRAGKEIVQALAIVLTHLARVVEPPVERVTSFHSTRAPPLSVTDYLFRIAKYFQCSNECFVLCLVYIDRIVKLQPDFWICDLNIHRILATASMLAVKFFDDIYYSNAYYSKVAGIRLREANNLEAQFLALVDWRLHVTPEEYDGYRLHVFAAMQGLNPAQGLQLAPPTTPALAPPTSPSPDAEAATADSPERRTPERL
eukprot:TRINITY_DN26842_c0_g1_i1.p1 TRINITY_DN26842_c0_g1~~TRINITY_DN26842_c0_g1_i1.p1  ORF type:complete len:218 (+),score=43.56 TRINITY_DN26842_c0_g1_i1:141-794(+)